MSEHGEPALLSDAAREALAEALAAEERGQPFDIDGLTARFPELRSRAAALGLALGAARLGLGELAIARDAAALAEQARPPAKERYRLEAELGRGGMGVVYSVQDRHLRRRLALKCLREPVAGTSSGRRVARFLAEARRTGQLAHPGIVPVHDLGLDEQGRPFFTMPVVEGATLDELIERSRTGHGEWNLTRIVMVLLRVAETMSFAHARGVVHRDLKPANVMAGRFGEVYVLDWGLARAIGEGAPPTAAAEAGAEAGADARLTREGDVVGTPAFMAPELAGGGLGSASPASDVYALGAVLYQALCGAPPYDAERRRGGVPAVIAAACIRPPAPLEDALPRPPAELAAVCAKAMAREAGARYAGMDELAADLRAWLEGRVVRAYETGGWAELKKWVRRNRGLALVSGGLLAAVLAGLVAVAYVQGVGRARVVRLADRQLLDELTGEAEALWPADEARLPALADWLARARELAQRLPRHEQALEELDARAERAREVRGAAGSWTFADTEERWLHEKMRELVQGLRAFDSSTPPGLLAHVDGRARQAATLRARSIDERGAEWEAARVALRPLELAPQMGLVPLGPDPASGLQEFAHLPSGEAPLRGADGRLALGPESGVVLVFLPGGRFDMGARRPRDPSELGLPNVDPRAFDAELPVHAVELEPYFLAKHEFGRAQWRRIAGSDPSFGSDPAGADELRPVDSISWHDAVRILARVGLVLPTEAQWESAARAGTSTPWPWGDDPAAVLASGEVYRAASSAIDAHAASPWGFHGLIGNLSEWCADGSGDSKAHRGGWFSLGASGENDELVAQIARASMRMHAGPGEFRPIIGIRAARAIDP